MSVGMAQTQTFEDIAAGRATLGRALGRLVSILARPELTAWRPVIALALGLTIISRLLNVYAPFLLGDAINALSGEGEADLALFGQLALLFIALRWAAVSLPYLRDAVFAPVTQAANRTIAVDAFAHAQSLSLQFHVTRRTGALTRVIDRGAGSIDYLLRFLAFNIAPTLVELVLAAIALWAAFGAAFAAIAVSTVLVFIAFTVVVTEWRARQRRVMNRVDSEFRARAMDSLTNFETVKAFAAEEREAQRYHDSLAAYQHLALRMTQSLAGLNAGQELIMNTGLGAAILVAGYGVASGALDGPGDVTTVMLVLLNLYRPLNILGWAWREIRQGVVDMETLFGLFDVAPEVADKPDAPALKPQGGAVRFEDVRFTHEGRMAGVDAISLDIAPGSFVGLVGPSGAGKSTLLKLLFRFYDPAAGRVYVDGQDIRDVTQASLRGALGLVPQEVVLFNDTLRYNIGYAAPDADEAAILDAARRAQLGDLIASLPDGLDTRVGERGLKLSGGEKQRVGVARAILKDPCILVLDEATSSLDSGTEQEVQAALAEAARGRTTIAVAHRLSTIAAADHIVVLDDGRIVEQGDHNTLLAHKGLYAGMWARQAEGGGEDGRPAAAVIATSSAVTGSRG